MWKFRAKQAQKRQQGNLLHQKIHLLKDWLNEQIVGQNHLVERLIIALLADGHLLG